MVRFSSSLFSRVRGGRVVSVGARSDLCFVADLRTEEQLAGLLGGQLDAEPALTAGFQAADPPAEPVAALVRSRIAGRHAHPAGQGQLDADPGQRLAAL